MNPMDPTNPTNALCMQGMQAEGEGNLSQARRLFQQAWDNHTGPAEGAVAAHFLARQQDSREGTLLWNQRAIDEARDVEGLEGFLPSLHLNLGKSHEDVDDLAQALQQYLAANAHIDHLGDDSYGQIIRGGINAALKRLGGHRP